MAEMQGMLAVTPELEAQGRMGDTEVGTIDLDALVIPKDVFELEEAKGFLSELGKLYEQVGLDINNFTVTPGNTNYSVEESNTQAHLTNGELVIPPGMLQAAEGLTDILSELYTLANSNINQYIVGNEANNINPETGLPEFWGFIRRIVRKITKPIKSIFDKAKDLVKDAWKGIKTVGSNVLSGIKKVASSPIAQIALQVALPQYAPYINAATKVANGQKLGAADFVSLGVRGYNDITGGNFQFNSNALKAVNAAERIADGADVKEVLISSYGGDFAKSLGLDTKVKDTLTGLVGEDNSKWLSENIDFNQAAADLTGGASTYNILANQFGDKIAKTIGSGDPNMEALGYAGIRVGRAIDDGASTQEAIYRGAREYYDRGGELPDFGEIADFADFKLPDVNLPELNLNVTDWFKDQDWNLEDLRLRFGDWKGLSDLNIDWKKYKPDLGKYNFADFKVGDLGEIEDLGIDLGDIDLGLNLPEFIDLPDIESGKKVAALPEEEDLFARTTDNELLKQEEEAIPLSRQLLSQVVI